jgi:hypothetical protein
MAKSAREIHMELTGSEGASSLIGGLLAGETRKLGNDDDVFGGGAELASRRLRRQYRGAGHLSRAGAEDAEAAMADRFAAGRRQMQSQNRAAAVKRQADELQADFPGMSWEDALSMADALVDDEEVSAA